MSVLGQRLSLGGQNAGVGGAVQEGVVEVVQVEPRAVDALQLHHQEVVVPCGGKGVRKGGGRLRNCDTASSESLAH